MHMEDLRLTKVHSVSHGSLQRPHNDEGHTRKDLRRQHGDDVHAPGTLMIVHSDGIEQRKMMICGRMVWKTREDRAMRPDDRSKEKDKWG
jgi:hypothetical protein